MTTKENDNVVVNNNKSSSKTIIAIVLVTSLFFVWGLTMNLVNALNSPFGHYLNLNNTEAALLQVAYFGAYFVMAASDVYKRQEIRAILHSCILLRSHTLHLALLQNLYL